jgi:hypothetical protein
MKYYLLTVCGQVDPVLTGPLDTEEKVLAMASEHWAVDNGHEDGLFSLYIDEDGELHANAFLNTDFEDEVNK